MVRAKRCCVHAYFRINGVSKRWFKTPKNVRLRSWLEQNADSGGSMNAKSHITTFKWRHINAFPVHLSSNNSLEQCAVHAHEIVFFSREAWTVLPWRAFWIGVLNQRFKTLILPSQNKHERSLRDGVGSSEGDGCNCTPSPFAFACQPKSRLLLGSDNFDSFFSILHPFPKRFP